MKNIRRFVKFDYDLRKPLKRGQKGAITKAFKEITAYKSKRYIPLPKRRKETKTAFKRRRKKIKSNLGQMDYSGRLVKGVFVDVPMDTNVEITDDQLIFYTDNFTDTAVGSDQELLATDPEAEVERVWNELEFDSVAINYSGFGRSAGFGNDDYGYENFKAEIMGMSLSYWAVLEHAISGYILRINY